MIDDREYSALQEEVGRLLAGERGAGRRAVEQERVRAYWAVGRRLHGVMPARRRGMYGRQILQRLAADLEVRERLLYEMVQFFRAFEMLPTSASLGWSHYRALLKVGDSAARAFYLEETVQGDWSVRRLESQIQARVFAQHGGAQERMVSPRQGRLYTYRLQAGAPRPRLDLGFGVYHAAAFPGVEAVGCEEIVEVARDETPGGCVYHLTPSALGKPALYTYQAVVERVVDGDTLWAEIDCGFHIWVRQKLRLRGIDTPELSRAAGQEARDWVLGRMEADRAVQVRTERPDKYGRYLADVFLADGGFLNGELVARGEAVVW